MSLDDINKKAEEIRKKEEAKLKKSSGKRKSKRKVEHSPASFYVFSRIYPYSIHIIFILFLVIGTGLSFFFLFYPSSYWLLYTGLPLISLFVVALFINYLKLLYLYEFYKKFMNKPPFIISGWTRLGKGNFPKSKYWIMEVTVKIEVIDNTNKEQIKLIDDALYIFSHRSNKFFYTAGVTAGFGGDPRNKWKENGSLSVCGSACSEIMGEMYLLMCGSLKDIQQKYNCIRTFRILYKERKAYEIETEDTSYISV